MTVDVVREWCAMEAEIVRVYGVEKSVDRTAGRLGLGPCQVKNVLRAHGLVGRRLLPAETRARILELAAAGVSGRAIALEVGWSYGTVKRVVSQRRT